MCVMGSCPVELCVVLAMQQQHAARQDTVASCKNQPKQSSPLELMTSQNLLSLKIIPKSGLETFSNSKQKILECSRLF